MPDDEARPSSGATVRSLDPGEAGAARALVAALEDGGEGAWCFERLKSSAGGDRLATDVDGLLVIEEAGALRGIAAGIVGDGTLRIALLAVLPAERGHGLGGRLLDALLAQGRRRRCRRVEAFIPATGEAGTLAALALFARRGLPVVGAALELLAPVDLERSQTPPPRLEAVPLQAGAGLGGWLSEMDREARGHSRAADVAARLGHGARGLVLRAQGRPAAWTLAEGSRIGPGAVRSPDLLEPLVTAVFRTGLVTAATAAAARPVSAPPSLWLASDAADALGAARRVGFTARGRVALLCGTRPGPDLRRALLSPLMA